MAAMDRKATYGKISDRFVATVIAMLACIICITFATTAARAADIPWPPKARFQYVAQKKDLRELLREFITGQGIAVSISNGVEGSVSGKFDLSPQAMLDLLASTYGLVWYYDGSLLNISPASDVRTEVVQLRYGNIEQLQLTLARLGILDRRFPLHIDADGETVIVSGPARYVELVLQVVDNLEGRQGSNQATEVRVFPLHFAWAADHDFSSGGKSIVIPGVASVLDSMYHSGSDRSIITAQAPTAPKALQPLQPAHTMENADASNPYADKSGQASTYSSKVRRIVSAENQQLPIVQADTRLNAVLVRDIPARMKQHDELIKALDIRPAMIEIEARIIEVSSDDAQNLGVDWRLNSTPTADAGNSLSRLSDVRDFMASGGVLKAVLENSGLNLLERISFLAAHGRAKVVSSPSVLTLNNLEARMDNQESFYVRVAGYQSSGLFNITAGVTLHVTPLIVDDGTNQKIKLDVRIEDGHINTQTVDQIPTVKTSIINTQGFVSDGKSLLIAGYSVEQSGTDQSNVPGLSSIPLLGALFRSDGKTKSKIQKMYLLTPRIVDAGSMPLHADKIIEPPINRDMGVTGITLKMETALILRDLAQHDKSGADMMEPLPDPFATKATPEATTTLATAPIQLQASNTLQSRSDHAANSLNDASKPPVQAAASANTTQVSTQDKTVKWEIAPSDRTLKNTLTRWAKLSGWQVSWELDFDYPIEAETTITGTFEQAVETVANSMSHVEHPMRVILYSGNKVLRIVAKGGE